VAKQPSKPRWSTERRLEFIEFRLYWEGRINRGDLVDFFGISVPQASSDLTNYQEAAEGNIVYDKTAKAYVASPRFKPVFFNPSADRYLAELRLLNAELLSEGETWVSRPPEHAIVPNLRRRLDPKILRSFLDAIRTRSSVEVNYQSFSRPEPMWRRISPHALAFDGFRWHARAWCHTRETFLDFVIGRVLGARSPKPAEIDPGKDVGWTQEVTLKIGPHPKLKDGWRRATELDYGMVDGVLEVTTKACLVQYFTLRFGLDRDSEKLQPTKQQIVLLNRQEIEPILEATGVTLDMPSR